MRDIPAPDKPKVEPKEEWAINIDINTPVGDFYKRIPDMAYKVNLTPELITTSHVCMGLLN